MARISFVVPFYKVPYEYMHQCIKSILEQSFSDIEIILVDDGSPDDCGKICDEYKEIDNRVVVIHKKNGGLSDARNAGIAVATAQWITFVDGDDWIEKDYCEDFINRVSRQDEKADIYIYSGFREYPSGQVQCVPHFTDGTRFKAYREREYLQSKCCTIHHEKNGNRRGMTISSAWGKMYNTDFIRNKDLLFPRIPYDEDSIFYLYAVEAASSVEYASKAIYHYRYTMGSIVNRYRPNAKREQDIYLAELFDFAERYNKSDDFISKMYLRVMTSMLLAIKLYFFNRQNASSYFERRKECVEYFGQEPYLQVFNKVKISDLGRNAKIKYILLRLKCYGLAERLRKLNENRLIQSSKNR